MLHRPMTVLLAALVIAQNPNALVEPTIPTPVLVEIGKPLQYTIRRVSKPIDPQIGNRDGSLDWTIRGKVVHIPQHTKGRLIWRATPGRDGSMLCTESEDTYIATDHSFIIKSPSQKKLIASAYMPGQLYLDAQTSIYASNWDLQDSPLGSMFGPPELHVRQEKIDRYYGLGDPMAVCSTDEILTTIPIDERGVPCTREFVASGFLRFYLHRKPLEIGNFDYLGSLRDHTLLLWRSESHWDGSDDRTGVFDWRLGKFLRARKLPRDWKPIVVNRRGDILLRKNPGYDEDWDVAILRDNVMTPISFARPPGTERMLWAVEPSFDENCTILFKAYLGRREEYYALAFRSNIRRAKGPSY